MPLPCWLLPCSSWGWSFRARAYSRRSRRRSLERRWRRDEPLVRLVILPGGPVLGLADSGADLALDAPGVRLAVGDTAPARGVSGGGVASFRRAVERGEPAGSCRAASVSG